jgi:hypothetical protein
MVKCQLEHEDGEDAPACQRLLARAECVCPGDWVEKWNEDREEGNWYGYGAKKAKEAHGH